MFDATGRFASPFLSSSYNDLGGYDQCLAVSVDNVQPFTGKHCIARLNWPLPDRARFTPLPKTIDLKGTDHQGTWLEVLASIYRGMYYDTHNIGVCYPSTCTTNDVQQVIDFGLKGMAMNVTIDRLCDQSMAAERWPLRSQISILIISIVTVLVIVATWTGRPLDGFLIHFDARSNTRKLFADSSDSNAHSLSWIHGYRVLYSTIILITHVCLVSGFWTPATHSGAINYARGQQRDWLRSGLIANVGNMVGANFVLG